MGDGTGGTLPVSALDHVMHTMRTSLWMCSQLAKQQANVKRGRGLCTEDCTGNHNRLNCQANIVVVLHI